MATIKFNGFVFEGSVSECNEWMKLQNGVKGSTIVSKDITDLTANPLTDEERAIIKKYAPTHKLGTDEGSIHWAVRGCAYEFCGGRKEYTKNKDLYLRGKKGWFLTFTKEVREELPDEI